MDVQTFQTLYKKARQLAMDMHKNQMYGKHHYIKHLEDVQTIMMTFGISINGYDNSKYLLIAGWLHDLIEDTAITKENIEQNFGKEVANLVWAVTDEQGENRSERFEKTWPKIQGHPLAVYLKLADRLVNTIESLKNAYNGRPALFSMYKKEYPMFVERLYLRGSSEPMWQRLDYLMSIEVDILKGGMYENRESKP